MNSKHHNFLNEKLAQYQNDELSREERDMIDQWFDQHFTAATTELPADDDTSEQLRLELLNRVKIYTASERKIFRLPYRWIGIACSLLLVVGIAFLFQGQLQHDQHTRDSATQTFHTAEGKIQKITLNDGTEIWMNAATTIRIASDFSSSASRRVYLDQGEAFFKVKRDTLRPFSIATKKMLTTVLGTSFNIKAYPDAQIYQVAVNTGKVKVAQKGNQSWNVLSKGLVKGEVLTYHTNSGKTEIESRNTVLISNWKTDRSIYADGLTMTQIGAEISRQYAITVQVAAGVNDNKKYHLTLPHQDLKTVLQHLARATGINYQLTNSQLIINPAIE